MAKALTANEKILNDYIKHQTHLLRYADGLSDEMVEYLNNTDLPLYDALIKWLREMEDARDLSTNEGRSWQDDFEETVASIREPAWDELEEDLTGQLKELAITEAQGASTIIQGAIPVVLGLQTPPADKLVAIVNSQPFEGRVLKEWLAKAKRTDVDGIVAQAKAGIIQGKTPIEVTRTIMGNKSNDFEDGAIKKKIRRDIQSLVRTITNGVQNEAKQALYEANADIIEQEQFVATLDSSTTLICAVNDNKIFKRGTGPMPPLHFGCRSLRVPFFDADRLGNRAFDPSTEKTLVKEYAEKNDLGNITSRDKLPYGTKGDFDKWARKRRRELIGQTPSTTSYADWFKNQSPEFQDELLGKGKAELYRQGNLSLDKFVSREGKPLTLTELKTKHSDLTNNKEPFKINEVSYKKGIFNGEKEIVAKEEKKIYEKHNFLMKNMRKECKIAVREYLAAGGAWKDLNKNLRERVELSREQFRLKQDLDKVVNAEEIKVSRLFRGVTNLPLDEQMAQELIGKEVTNQGFMSTSLSPSIAKQFGMDEDHKVASILEFNLNGKAKNGAYLGAREASGDIATDMLIEEKEVLLPTNTGYKIVDVRKEISYNTKDEPITVLVYEAEFLN